jgi:hypothetical protein
MEVLLRLRLVDLVLLQLETLRHRLLMPDYRAHTTASSEHATR